LFSDFSVAQGFQFTTPWHNVHICDSFAHFNTDYVSHYA